MLTIETIRRSARGFGGTVAVPLAVPLVVRIGLVVLLLGGLADLVAHFGVAVGEAEPGQPAGHAGGHSPDEVAAHVVVFVGMVLILLGVVIDGVKRARPGRRAGRA
ncbi:MAG: hypothetical protein L0221_11155 [Chloroflexi bacterium]|nr:hypothetical protein [Chloroflexota bacterium]